MRLESEVEWGNGMVQSRSLKLIESVSGEDREFGEREESNPELREESERL